jgi:hypothetical protein
LGRKDGPLADLQFEVEAKLAVPPWVQGALQADASSALNTSIEGDLMGGRRYEQLFRATGAVRVGGAEDQLAKLANWTFPALQQAGVRFRWEGEETYGMLERSSPMDTLTR